MNLFWLHPDPEICAKMHVDKHVNKMLTESVQILCTSSYINGHNKFWMYEPYMVNHPVVRWAKESYRNWRRVYKVAECLYDEYKYRHGRSREHDAGEMLSKFENGKVKTVFSVKDRMTEPPQAIKDWPHLDEEYADENNLHDAPWAEGFDWPHVIEAYRYYYVGDKSHIAKWKIRGRPQWWDVYESSYEAFMRSQGCGSMLNSQ